MIAAQAEWPDNRKGARQDVVIGVVAAEDALVMYSHAWSLGSVADRVTLHDCQAVLLAWAETVHESP